MSDGEKLVDLITDVLDFVDWDSVEELVEYLIANGVVIQKQGEWVKHGYKWMCTNCHSKINIDGTPTENNLFYCSRCGAKLKVKL